MNDPFNHFGAAEFPAEFFLSLLEAAGLSARKAARKLRRPPPKRGRILQPGLDTPLWNELVKQTLPLLKQRGSKAQLARLLGLPRQRLHDCLKAKRACLDAERTIFLLCWVAARQQGRELTP